MFSFERAAALIHDADVLFFTTGCGIDNENTPQGQDASAWGYHVLKYKTYTGTDPQDVYRILTEWGRHKSHGYAVFTSTVNGYWNQAPTEVQVLVECNGSMNYMQCAANCRCNIWHTDYASIINTEPESITQTGSRP